jgi:hypothetical protein
VEQVKALSDFHNKHPSHTFVIYMLSTTTESL